VESFNGWTKKNCLLLNTIKTKELVVDFRRSKTPYQSFCIDGEEIDCLTCKYLGVLLDNVYVYAFIRLFYPKPLTNEDITLQLTSKLTICYVEGNH